MSIFALSSVTCKPEVRAHASVECPPGVAGIRVVFKGEVDLSTSSLEHSSPLFMCVSQETAVCVWRNQHRGNHGVTCPGRRWCINYLCGHFLIVCPSASLSKRIMRTDI